MQPGIVAPREYQIRKPTDPQQKNGRMANAPRFMTMGGLTGKGKWPTGSQFPVESPGEANGAKRVAAKD